MVEKKKHLGSLVILRGLAALAVVFCHFGLAVNNEVSPVRFYEFWHDYGERGVDVFFVVSGFVIPFSLFVGGYRIADFVTFVKKRFVRLQIPYVAALILTIALIFGAAYAKAEVADYRWLDFLKGLFYLHIPGQNPVFWTLKVEAQYYLYIGLIYPLLRKFPRWFVGLGVPLSLLTFYLPSPLDPQIWHYLVYFNIGIVGFMTFVKLGNRTINFVAIAAMLALTGFYSVASFLATTFALLFILFYQGRVPGVLNFLGKISYSLYLIHFPIGIKFINLANRFTPLHLRFVLFIGATLLVIGLAAIFYRLFEKPAERLSKSYRYAAKTTKSPSG